jgi:molybdopterin-binding protein
VDKIVPENVSEHLPKEVHAIGDQQITSIIIADADRQLLLPHGQTSSALMKSMDGMIIGV